MVLAAIEDSHVSDLQKERAKKMKRLFSESWQYSVIHNPELFLYLQSAVLALHLLSYGVSLLKVQLDDPSYKDALREIQRREIVGQKEHFVILLVVRPVMDSFNSGNLH